MTVIKKSMLSAEPTNIVHQPVTIGHMQLRDLVICPEQRGVVNYVHDRTIMERDITSPDTPSTTLVNLGFVPNTIASLNLPNSNERLLAAGGQDAELHLSLHRRRGSSSPDDATEISPRQHYDSVLVGSINNSVLLTSLNLTRSHESSVEPRVTVSNNDCTVKFFDVAIPRSRSSGASMRISEAGVLRLDAPVNHSSISPDGRTLLSVGDSPHVYLHALTGGARITFTPLMKLSLPAQEPRFISQNSNSIPASFSTAFSACGNKFAVASQEGVVSVWDVRSTKPLKVYYTDRTRAPEGHWYDDAWDWSQPGNSPPGWGARNVKFSPAGHGGKEIMTFTEHTSLLHVIDASTFETEEIIRVPSLVSERISAMPPAPATSNSESWTTQIPRLGTATPAPQPRVYLNGMEFAHRSATISPARALYIHRQRSRGVIIDADEEENTAPISVQVPSLGDRNAERDVRLILGRHGVRATGPANDGRMEIDELEPEFDCITSRAPSPTPTPAPTSSWRRRPPPATTPARRGSGPWRLTVPPHLDIAGTCFDPSGKHVYVASEDCIVEWSVRGAEKTWWSEPSWA